LHALYSPFEAMAVGYCAGRVPAFGLAGAGVLPIEFVVEFVVEFLAGSRFAGFMPECEAPDPVVIRFSFFRVLRAGVPLVLPV
jgi:hypothetical protein